MRVTRTQTAEPYAEVAIIERPGRSSLWVQVSAANDTRWRIERLYALIETLCRQGRWRTSRVTHLHDNGRGGLIVCLIPLEGDGGIELDMPRTFFKAWKAVGGGYVEHLIGPYDPMKLPALIDSGDPA